MAQHKSKWDLLREQRLGRTRGQRECLDCGRMFTSDGPWNRICPRCKTAAEDREEYAVETSGYVAETA